MVKRILTIVFLTFLLIFCVLACLCDYPRNITFSCSKQKNICTYSGSNLFKHKVVKTIEFDKIKKSQIVEKISEKDDDISSHSYLISPTQYYYYEWTVYYNNNGKTDELVVFRTSDYEGGPAYESLDKEYRYYVDVTRIFNSFLEDKSKSRISVPEYSDNRAKEQDFWMSIFVMSFNLTYILCYTYIIIYFIIIALEQFVPEGKIKQILKYICKKLDSFL